MSVARIATRYAKSLFDLAVKAGKLDKVHEDITYVREVARNHEFAAVMKNPLISTEKKEGIFAAIFKEKVEEITLNTLMVMAEHKRESYLKDICVIFHSLYNKAKHISKVIVTTAEAVSEQTVENILAEFKAKGLIEAEVELTTKIDSSIVGGFIVQFGDQVYNASIAYKIEQLRTKFSENLYIKNF
jgi:F-type H+-transporting ATPase subunit delta